MAARARRRGLVHDDVHETDTFGTIITKGRGFRRCVAAVCQVSDSLLNKVLAYLADPASSVDAGPTHPIGDGALACTRSRCKSA